MSTSIRQQIMTALDTRLKTIKTTAGYNTNAGNHVYSWGDAVVPLADQIALEHRDPEENQETLSVGVSGRTQRTLSIEIRVFSADAGLTLETARKAIADVEKAIGTDPHWSSLAVRTTPIGNEMETAQNEKKIARAYIRFAIIYVTTTWNPYS